MRTRAWGSDSHLLLRGESLLGGEAKPDGHRADTREKVPADTVCTTGHSCLADLGRFILVIPSVPFSFTPLQVGPFFPRAG